MHLFISSYKISIKPEEPFIWFYIQQSPMNTDKRDGREYGKHFSNVDLDENEMEYTYCLFLAVL